MHAGKVLASDSPAALVKNSGHATLEEAFIGYLKEASGLDDEPATEAPPVSTFAQPRLRRIATRPARSPLQLLRLFSYTLREGLELRRDPSALR